jgi:hypothetical protein
MAGEIVGEGIHEALLTFWIGTIKAFAEIKPMRAVLRVKLDPESGTPRS